MIEEGSKVGYYVNNGKSWLILKDASSRSKAEEIFGNSVNITSEGKRHLGAVIGSDSYKELYCKEMVDKWTKELMTLYEIADTHPQMAFSAYIKGFRSNTNH